MRLLENRREDGRDEYILTEEEIKSIIVEASKTAAVETLTAFQSGIYQAIGQRFVTSVLGIVGVVIGEVYRNGSDLQIRVT